MLSFLAKHPPRTKVAHLDTIVYDRGRALVRYKPPSDQYLVINRLPPAPADAAGNGKASLEPNCALTPPLHWHYYQSETFHVLEGTAKFVLDGEERIAATAEVVTVPAQQIHTFRNASTEDEMVVEFVLDPRRREKDEAFLSNTFRHLFHSRMAELTLTNVTGNAQTYRDDCRKAGMQRSLFQTLLFNRLADVIPVLPVPGVIAKPVGLMMNFLGGLVVGKWILGYSESYAEYYHRPRSDQD